MRSAVEGPLILASVFCGLAAGCGNLSNDDIAFLAAIPQGAALHVEVPAPASQPACLFGDASVFLNARATGDSLNAGLDSILALVDSVRSATPTTRGPDRRTWGPFPDGKHPGVDILVIMARVPAETAGRYRYLYSFEARRSGGPFLPVLEGTFLGARAESGTGVLEIHFDNSRALGINSASDPAGTFDFFYDLASEPRTLEFQLHTAGLGLAAFTYQYAGYRDGHAFFSFTFADKNGTRYFVDSKFARSGRGTSTVQFRTAASFTGAFTECWYDTSCIAYLDDPYALNPVCSGLAPCTKGVVSECPTFP
jgi:hypothetical protein